MLFGRIANSCTTRSNPDRKPLVREQWLEGVLVYRPHVGFIGRDETLSNQAQERFIQQHHSFLFARLDRRRDLEGLALADQVSDGTRIKQNLEGRHAAATLLLAKGLRDDAAHRLGEHHPDLPLLVGRPENRDWDVFGTDGEFLQQVAIPLGDEMNDGTTYLVGGGKLVVVKGTSSSFDGDDNPDDEEEETEVEPLEVICYEMR